MLSYQHIYHAGNMADVHKHLWLLCVLEYLGRKNKPFFWIDTHAGRGLYDLSAAEAQKLVEYKNGIEAVMEHIRTGDSPVLKLYEAKITAVNNGESEIKIYPGSTSLAAQMLRSGDQLVAFELHPKEYEYLTEAMKSFKNAVVRKEDGYKGIRSLSPPPVRRGGMLIDPSYEVKEEYAQVAKELGAAVKKWPQGVYMVWYPILAAGRHEKMCTALTKIAQDAGMGFTRDEWTFNGAEKGLLGSGMFILNPPYTCAESMELVKNAIWGRSG